MEPARQMRVLLKPCGLWRVQATVFGGLPLALAYWLEKRYQECCDVLEREDVEVACSESFIYFNLLGMSSRHLKFGETKARAAL